MSRLFARLRADCLYCLAVLGALPIAGLLAGCGGSTALPARAHPSATPTAAPTSAPVSPMPQVPPVVMIEQNGGSTSVLQAMDASGTPLWSVPLSTALPQVGVAGPRIFEVQTNQVSVFDRNGHPLGSGDRPDGSAVFSPTSAEWAWSHWDGVSPSPLPSSGSATASGSFWVAGVGEPAHKVYSWTETESSQTVLNAFDGLVMWSDQGLVSSEVPPWAWCASGHQGASYIIDPASGARTNLAGDAVVDVHAGVIVSAPREGANTPQSIILGGRTSFTWTNSAAPEYNIEDVHVSPAGDVVAVALITPGCAGQVPKAQTALISVADHSVRFVADAAASGWLDDTHLIADVNLGTLELDVVGLDGTRSLLGHGRLLGVLTAS